jgi:S1-C subfamily serine protease
MSHAIGSLLVALAGLLLSPPPDGGDKKAVKETYDDQTAEVKTTVDGKETVKKLSAKRCLKVRGTIDQDGFRLQEVTEGGPAMRLTTIGDGGQPAELEKGDIVVEVDGKKIRSAADYVAALDGAKDAEKVRIKVIDINTNMPMEFTAPAEERK